MRGIGECDANFPSGELPTRPLGEKGNRAAFQDQSTTTISTFYVQIALRTAKAQMCHDRGAPGIMTRGGGTDAFGPRGQSSFPSTRRHNHGAHEELQKG